MLNRPASVYINWSAYDELSDNIELTEEIALTQLDHLLRLRRQGCRFDYYVNDAYWFARDGGYRTFRSPNWPDGPDRWLDRCLKNHVLPGLWVTANTLSHMDCFPAWRDSLDPNGAGLCCFHGGFLPHFMETLHLWYARGVRCYKFDFANFSAAPESVRRAMLPSEIRQTNIAAFRGALAHFRNEHPDCLLLAYNGFEDQSAQDNTALPPRKTIDTRWLDVFDSLYCGDPRPADVPAFSFWRSKDVYSDHMTRYYHASGFPLSRIDNAGFMIGTTGTCYFRKTAAWRAMLVLSLARGGWANTYYGNLDLLSDEDAQFMATAQAIFLPLQQQATWQVHGAMPGDAQPYAFSANTDNGALVALVNPAQSVQRIPLPFPNPRVRILFRDSGFVPDLTPHSITLGPEQCALVGTGRFADETYDLGLEPDVHIPASITPLDATFAPDGERAIAATISPPSTGQLRIIYQQRDSRGMPRRTSGGSPPNGTTLANLLSIQVTQNQSPIPVTLHYDKAIWSGLSWAAAQVPASALKPGVPVKIRCATTDPLATSLTAALYVVE